MISNDDLSKRLRGSKPVDSLESVNVHYRSNLILESILTGSAGETPSRAQLSNVKLKISYRNFKNLALILASALLLSLGSFLLIPSVPSIAEVARPLSFSYVQGTDPERLVPFLQMNDEDTRKVSTLFLTTWHLGIDGEGELDPRILPQQISVVFKPNNLVHVLTHAGTAFDLYLRTDERYRAGRLIADESWEIMPSPPPNSSDMPNYFLEVWGIPEGAPSWDYFAVVPSIYQSSPLTPKKESALLQFLITLEGTNNLGRTIDRLGREGFGVSSNENAEAHLIEVLVFSESAGELLSTESVFTGPSTESLTSPYIQNYVAIERQ